ncbi:redoxin domain-containing protein [SAR202 cluster bacterium AC-647-N09_OGT_505m]|nr:redoxin domain-containing protein [SAR202 cluster bacterium AC-647-N09_OGT_505m]
MYREFRYLDSEVVGISMDNVSETAILAKVVEADFKLLSDPDGKVVKEYGIYNLLGDGLATPAVFIIGLNRHLEWSHVGTNIGDRPATGDILARLK